MVIEWLKIRVDSEKREEYVKQDAEIWTAALSKYPGFLSKEVWISPENLSEVVLVIHWESFEKWHAIPLEELERIEAKFAQVMGTSYELIEATGYQLRKRFQP
ncbi:MAG: TIGR03792 family protein [Leptolyngbyaceae cyanobacterium CRU_2_3]|nr:TIGR03792 family protein [Leptolyngbyaceae cyanobacterium CRU_2_3]